eukprot:TRINITY_DN5030_c0_g1_i3.p1 TRINITY_DN5030_c0_g1~~TRINITY_DN5030_c0_g1_i3.p1  ORF type:complete len:923 (-),score=211.16 TRINITY_DN5030_c0_g1_i3:445-3213(-)
MPMVLLMMGSIRQRKKIDLTTRTTTTTIRILSWLPWAVLVLGASLFQGAEGRTAFEKLTDLSYAGETYYTIRNLSLYECQGWCREEPECQAASFSFGITKSPLRQDTVCLLQNGTQANNPTANPRTALNSYYMVKMSIRSDKVCKRPWNFERVPNKMIAGHDKALIFTSTKEACLAACLNERNFICRSAEYNYVTLQCRLSDHDRRTVRKDYAPVDFVDAQGVDYFENLCLSASDACLNSVRNYASPKLGIPEQKISLHVGIQFYVDKELMANSIQACDRACNIEAEFLCRSYLYLGPPSGKDYNCKLYHLDHWTLPDYEKSFRNSDLSSSELPNGARIGNFYENRCGRDGDNGESLGGSSPGGGNSGPSSSQFTGGSGNANGGSSSSYGPGGLGGGLFGSENEGGNGGFSTSGGSTTTTTNNNNNGAFGGNNGFLGGNSEDGNNFNTGGFGGNNGEGNGGGGKYPSSSSGNGYPNSNNNNGNNNGGSGSLNGLTGGNGGSPLTGYPGASGGTTDNGGNKYTPNPSGNEVDPDINCDFLGTCYDVTVHCKDTRIVVNVGTNRPFSGRIYALGRSETCNVDVINSNAFRLDLTMSGQDCNTQSVNGVYTNTVVVQRHSVVMTKTDKIYKVRCTYDTSSKNITFGMMPIRDPDMISITSAPEAPAPRISILDKKGKEVETVRIGDKLRFKIEIPDKTPYGIFARSCVAMAKDSRSTFPIIDKEGCPIDPTIFPRFTPDGNALISEYEAFRFTESYGVIFQCNVKYCLGPCEPANCIFGREGFESWGKRKRRAIESQEVDKDEESQMRLSHEIIVLDYGDEQTDMKEFDKVKNSRETPMTTVSNDTTFSGASRGPVDWNRQSAAEDVFLSSNFEDCPTRSSVLALIVTCTLLVVLYICSICFYCVKRSLKKSLKNSSCHRGDYMR